MTNRNNDDIANALHGLASGEHVEEGEGPAPQAGPPGTPAPAAPLPANAAKPQAAGPRAPVKPARPVAPGAAPAQQRPAAPGMPGPARPAAPAAPMTPPVTAGGIPYVAPNAVPRAAPPGPSTPRQGPPANPVRASAPPPIMAQAVPRQHPPQPGSMADNPVGATAYDDDAVIMPAPSAEYLGHAPHAPAALRRPTGGGASAFLRDALVPVLFTCALLMLAAAALKFVVHPDAPLALMPPWLTGVLVLAAVVFVASGVMNIVLSRRAKR